MPQNWDTSNVAAQLIVGNCLNCSTLQQNDCYSFCPGYSWIVQGSGAGGCLSCSALFGANCVRCSSSSCLACTSSSGSSLDPSTLTCIVETCTVSNCMDCYSGGLKCARCQDGYQLDSIFTCAMSTCTVPQCSVC